MLQALLKERFQLVVHRETKELPIYSLVAGLTGLFDLNLDFNPDDSTSEGPTVFEAVQRQLGLKLEVRKGPIEVIVIDHVEKPSLN